MSKKSAESLTINLTDEGRLLTMRTILGYEAGVRGLTIGQTFVQLITEAANIDAYPEEVREKLDNVRESIHRQAIEKSLAVLASEKIA